MNHHIDDQPDRPCRRHDWQRTLNELHPDQVFTCTRCGATTGECGTCHKPLESSTARTCEPCISRARNHVREVRDLYRQLPDVIAGIAGLHAIRYDRGGAKGKARRATDTVLLGGAALVMATDGSGDNVVDRPDGTAIDWALRDAEHRDPPSVLGALTGWEDTWRHEQHQSAATRTSVTAATDYLVTHTAWAAGHSDGWADYLTDLAGLRGRLRMLTGQTQPPVKAGVPCPYCAGTIVQKWTGNRGSLSDIRECDVCGLTWASEAHFMLAIREAHQALPTTHPSLLVTMGDAKRIYRGRGVRPNLLDLWATRRQLRPAQTPDGHDRRDVRGELLYRLGDISDRLTPMEGSAS